MAAYLTTHCRSCDSRVTQQHDISGQLWFLSKIVCGTGYFKYDWKQLWVCGVSIGLEHGLPIIRRSNLTDSMQYHQLDSKNLAKDLY